MCVKFESGAGVRLPPGQTAVLSNFQTPSVPQGAAHLPLHPATAFKQSVMSLGVSVLGPFSEGPCPEDQE